MTHELFTTGEPWTAQSDFDAAQQIEVTTLRHGGREIAFAAAEAPEDALE